jgi:hypothetical protein
MPAAVNCKSFAFRISGISAGANSFDVSCAKSAPAPRRRRAIRRRQVGEVDRCGRAAQFLGDDRAAALAQWIGHD